MINKIAIIGHTDCIASRVARALIDVKKQELLFTPRVKEEQILTKPISAEEFKNQILNMPSIDTSKSIYHK